MSRTKIVATIGPSSRSPEVLRAIIKLGVDVARLNFSHGTHADHAENIANIRRVAKEENCVVGIMQDLQGPRVRVGDLAQPAMQLTAGEEVVLTSEPAIGQGNVIPVRGAELSADVKPGNTILIADGQIELRVRQVDGSRVLAEVITGGPISSHKGVNVPGVTLKIPSFTDKDRADLDFGLSQGVDWVATSFVRDAADIEQVREHIKRAGADTPIMAKIEKHEAVNRFDDILGAADGIMVARGDLGIEIPAEEVPIIQKIIIDRCNRVGKPVVTATQMLNSMIENPRPTRAEASDVANAILDGTDAVMLSGETAVGKYPVESVETMGRIATRAEEAFPYGEQLDWARETVALTPTEAISQATVEIAHELPAAAVLTLTQSGHTARQVAKYRPRTPIIASTSRPVTQQRLAMTWGVQPLLVDMRGSTDEMIEAAVRAARNAGLVANGDTVVITAGVPVGGAGRTNLLKIQTV